MPFINREDGERFVIPSYRDVLAIKQKSQLKKEILSLSANYGEYVTIQKKAADQYEVAFSPDSGYLLGESIWNYFNRPSDLIYCEAIPDTTEVIFVIVKSDSVYLDGSFPSDSIPEELVIFLTQENNFEIYVYGDVPIAEYTEEGKFSFERRSVKSFIQLDEPVFPKLPLYSNYQLKLVDQVLREQGIGVFPIKKLLTAAVLLGLAYMLYSFFLTPKEIVPQLTRVEENPYKEFYSNLNTPAPEKEIASMVKVIQALTTIPGWHANNIAYSKGNLSARMQSSGGRTENLFAWADANNMTVNVKENGFYLDTPIKNPNRPEPTKIYPIKEIIAVLIDKIAKVYPGNNIRLGQSSTKGVFTRTNINLSINGVAPDVLTLIGDQLKDLPLVLRTITMNVESNNSLSGTLTFDALGN